MSIQWSLLSRIWSHCEIWSLNNWIIFSKCNFISFANTAHCKCDMKWVQYDEYSVSIVDPDGLLVIIYQSADIVLIEKLIMISLKYFGVQYHRQVYHFVVVWPYESYHETSPTHFYYTVRERDNTRSPHCTDFIQPDSSGYVLLMRQQVTQGNED